MNKSEILAMVQKEKSSQRTALNASYYDDPSSRLLARVIEHCFLEDKVASFKDVDSMAKVVKKYLNDKVVSTYNNVIVHNDVGNFHVQYTTNAKDDLSKINTTMITVMKNGNIKGSSKTYTLVKSKYLDFEVYGEFGEKELSSYKIDDFSSVSYEELPLEGQELYRKMKICSSLLKPLLKSLMSLEAAEKNNEMNMMFDELTLEKNNNGNRASLK